MHAIATEQTSRVVEGTVVEVFGPGYEWNGQVCHARLWWAARGGQKRLSFEPCTRVREEAVATDGGKPLHRPIIRRNTPLPVTRTESYYTVRPGQTAA